MYQLDGSDVFQFRGAKPPYVFDVIPVSAGVVTISSDGILSVFDPSNVGGGPIRSLTTSHGNLTVARAVSEDAAVVATAGEDGTVALWDLRSATTNAQATTPTGSCNVILSMACAPQTNSIAVGTELINYQASIVVWDLRAGLNPKVRYDEVHSDDVTELNYHPANKHSLLSGSTDCLVNVIDTRVSDEDEAVVLAFNHGSSIHRAGFLNETEVFALSHDEKLAVYDTAETHEAGSATKDFGDLRAAIGGQYVANITVNGNGTSGAILGAGSQDGAFHLIHLDKESGWAFDLESAVDLPGAHGTEIVRDFCVLDEANVVYTCGEDGAVKKWSPPR